MLIFIIIVIVLFFYFTNNQKKNEITNQLRADRMQINQSINNSQSKLLKAVDCLNSIPNHLEKFYGQNHMDTSDVEIQKMKDRVYSHLSIFNDFKNLILSKLEAIKNTGGAVDGALIKNTNNLEELTDTFYAIYYNISNIISKEDFTGDLKEMYSQQKISACLDTLKYMHLCGLPDKEYENFLLNESKNQYVPFLFQL